MGLPLILRSIAGFWYSCFLPEGSRFRVPVEILTHNQECNQDCPAVFHCSVDIQLKAAPKPSLNHSTSNTAWANPTHGVEYEGIIKPASVSRQNIINS